MVLVHEKTGIPAIVGETLTDFRGETAVLTSWYDPKHSASTGRVYVGEGHGYYPSVFGLKFVEEK